MTPNSSASAPQAKSLKKLIVFALFLAVLGYVVLQQGDKLNQKFLSEQQAELEQLRTTNPVAVYGGAFLLYVVVAALALPLAAPLTLSYGYFFPLPQAVLLVSFASTTGATISFLLSRYLFRDTLQARFAERLTGFNQALEREGAFYLFSLRLLPVMPFWMLNLVMGLTPIRARTFYWVSQIGMLPATVLYLYAGSQLPDLKSLSELKASTILTPKMLIAFTLLAAFPYLVRAIMSRVRKPRAD